MKKTFFLSISMIFLIFILVGCSKQTKGNVSLDIWHYYNGRQKIAFDQLVVEFNETIGLEKGIIVEAFSQGNISQLEEKVIESVEEKVGARQVPNMVTIYPEVAYTLDQMGFVTNLEDYIRKEEIYEYVDSYIEEGRLGKDNLFKIFPIVKATEIMMVNKTDWDQFAAATGVSTEDLETWEGIRKVGEIYYNWTDSLTEKENDGRAFFGRDALANFMIIGSKQLGKEIFEVKGDEVRINLDPYIMRKLWDNYYIPYISGYYKSYGRFSTDDAKIGEIMALVGSTTGAAYFPDNVTIENEDNYAIDLLVLPLPNFKDTGFNAVQQGAGVVVLKSDKAQEKASVEFLKWFTEKSRNLDFAIETGYLPVKKDAYNMKELERKVKEKSSKGLSKQLELTIPLAMEQVQKYDLHTTKAFKDGREAREILGSSLENKAKEDRKKLIKLIDSGLTHKEAVEKFDTDKNFEKWLLEFQKSLVGANKK